jgi:hypothetical protein
MKNHFVTIRDVRFSSREFLYRNNNSRFYYWISLNMVYGKADYNENRTNCIDDLHNYTYWLSRTSGGFTSHRCGSVMLRMSTIHNLTAGFVVPGCKDKRNQTTNISKQRLNYCCRYAGFILNHRFLYYINIMKYRSKFGLCTFVIFLLFYLLNWS